MKVIKITSEITIDDDGIHCSPKCKLQGVSGDGFVTDYYCTIFTSNLRWDRRTQKHIRCHACQDYEAKLTQPILVTSELKEYDAMRILKGD